MPVPVERVTPVERVAVRSALVDVLIVVEVFEKGAGEEDTLPLPVPVVSGPVMIGGSTLLEEMFAVTVTVEVELFANGPGSVDVLPLPVPVKRGTVSVTVMVVGGSEVEEVLAKGPGSVEVLPLPVPVKRGAVVRGG